MIYLELKLVDNNNIKTSYQRFTNENPAEQEQVKTLRRRILLQRKNDFETEIEI